MTIPANLLQHKLIDAPLQLKTWADLEVVVRLRHGRQVGFEFFVGRCCNPFLFKIQANYCRTSRNNIFPTTFFLSQKMRFASHILYNGWNDRPWMLKRHEWHQLQSGIPWKNSCRQKGCLFVESWILKDGEQLLNCQPNPLGGETWPRSDDLLHGPGYENNPWSLWRTM